MYIKNTKAGFTLIELLIVIAIIGALASVVVVSLTGNTDDANEKVAKTNLSQARRLFTKLISIDVDGNKLEWKELCTKDLIEVTGIQDIITSGFATAGTTGQEYADGSTPTTHITGGTAGNETQGFLKTGLTTTTAAINASTAGCISSNIDGPNAAKGSWVIWVTGGTSVFCVDSGSSVVREISLNTSKNFVADTTNLNSEAPAGVGCDDIV